VQCSENTRPCLFISRTETTSRILS